MSDDLYEVWRDDLLIDAAARGDLLELEDDPAAGPLVALSVLADGGPLPTLDVDGVALVDSRASRRYAVRSLAAAVTAVATLSTSGVAAVVTGDPFRPAKAVWHEIQDHTGLRSDSAQGDSGAVLGAPAVEPRGADASNPSEVAVAPSASPAQGVTAPAPVRAPEQSTGAQTTSPERAQSSAAEDSAAQESAQPSYAEDDTQPSDEQDQSQEPAEPSGPDQQEPGDDAGSQPVPGEEQPAPDDQSGDDGLEDVVPPGTPDETLDEGTTQPAPTQGTPPEDGDADHEQVLSQPSSQPPSGTTQGPTPGSADVTYAHPTGTGTTAPPPTLAP